MDTKKIIKTPHNKISFSAEKDNLSEGLGTPPNKIEKFGRA